jgi:hypothetical protein
MWRPEPLSSGRGEDPEHDEGTDRVRASIRSVSDGRRHLFRCSSFVLLPPRDFGNTLAGQGLDGPSNRDQGPCLLGGLASIFSVTS